MTSIEFALEDGMEHGSVVDMMFEILLRSF